MMTREIAPSGPFHARIRVPGSKSITNRALVCAALAKGESILRNASDSDDTALMANGLNQLGVLVRRHDDLLIVHGTGGALYAPKFPIPVGNAGTTLRFLLSLATIAEGKVVFEAHERMAERPIDDLLTALRSLGARAEARSGFPLFTVYGGSLQGGRAILRGDKSSQFLSSLLMVSSYAARDVEIAIEGSLISSSYIDMTIEVMRRFGVETRTTASEAMLVRAGQRYRPLEFTVEPDASGASYFLGAAAITGGRVLIEGLREDSLQGDALFLGLLRAMGCKVVRHEAGVYLEGERRLKGIDVDMNSSPDTVPTLVAVSLFAEGETRIRNVAHLRYKESDRLRALATELEKLGATIALREDGLDVHPGPLHGAQLDTYEDHRLAMTFALIGLRVPGVKVENPECVKKSFPTFWREFQKLSHPENAT